MDLAGTNVGGNYIGEKTGTISVTMVDIAFTLAEGAVTEKEAPVYGDDWSKIVTIDPSKITAKVGNDVISGGTYSLNVSGKPNAGTNQAYQVLFTGTPCQNAGLRASLDLGRIYDILEGKA